MGRCGVRLLSTSHTVVAGHYTLGSIHDSYCRKYCLAGGQCDGDGTKEIMLADLRGRGK